MRELKQTIFNSDRTHRFTLWRQWDGSLPYLAVIGLNPSTADETNDDPTIRRCISFAKTWGLGGYLMLNAFSFRATDPEVMKAQETPNDPSNNGFLIDGCRGAGLVLCGWGVHGTFKDREKELKELLKPFNPQCLGFTKGGQPKHPLYIKGTTKPVPFV